MHSQLHLALEIMILTAVSVLITAWKKRTKRLPPPQFEGSRNSAQPWREYAKCSTTLGPIISINHYGSPIMVINNVDATLELLEKRSHFSCKPRWPIAELLGRQNNIGFLYYGERLKQSRKVLHAMLNAKAVPCLWDELLDHYSSTLLNTLLQSKSIRHDVESVIERFIVRLTYGREPQPEYLKLAATVKNHTSMALQPGRWLVNRIPCLKYVPAWIPGAGFKIWAREAREAFYTLTREPFQQTKSDISEAVAETSFVQQSLQVPSIGKTSEDIIMFAAGSIYSAGTDTLAGTILTAILLLIHHPEVQNRAYEEIISTIGRDRLPGLQDREALRYIDCVIQEVHRFNPAIPLVTHSNSKEDQYLGYGIPKKTWVLANVWAMLHNENEYKDPDVFFPERFLSPGSQVRDPRTLIYGFGRRICPGMHLANAFVYLVIARMIATFKFDPKVEDGVEQLPALDFCPGLVPFPKPFDCEVIFREGGEGLVNRTG
ncbi:cytochrome P450 [Daedaleopsis nitida]|nr:cytochrome P450 [Daedaleopsis nitida]